MKTKNILKFFMAASGILVLSACNDHDDNVSTSEHSATVETSAYVQTKTPYKPQQDLNSCLLYTSDAADEATIV